MGWLRLVGDILRGRPATSSTSSPRTRTTTRGPTAGRSSGSRRCFGTGFLPHRATTFGLPGLVAVVLLVVTCLGRRPAGVLLAGVLAALLAPFQFYAFPATYLIVGLYVADDRAPGASGRSGATRVLFLAPGRPGHPVHRRRDPAPERQRRVPVRRRLERGALRGRAARGRSSSTPPTSASRSSLALIAAVRRAAGCRSRWFLVAWLVALFVVPNVVVVSAVEFDMNKYFQIMWIAVGDPRRLAHPRAGRGRRSPAVLARLRHLAGAHRRLAPAHPAVAMSRPRRRPAAGSRRTRRTDRSSSPTRSSTARSTSPGGCGSRRSGRTSRTSATTRRRARPT